MESRRVVARILEVSGLSKIQLSSNSGISRSLIDSYLNGQSKPSLEQLQRLALAAGQTLSVTMKPVPEIPAEFVAVLKFGELFHRKDPKPRVNLGPVWRDMNPQE